MRYVMLICNTEDAWSDPRGVDRGDGRDRRLVGQVAGRRQTR